MSIFSNLFTWFKAKNNKGEELNVGYVLDGEPQTPEEVEKVFKALKLNTYFNTIQPLIKPKIDLTLIPVNETEITIGQSKVGGKPDVSGQDTWPVSELGKPLSFIAQLNFADTANVDPTGLLPKQGLVSFFYCADQEAWGFDPKDKHRFKVIYTHTLNDLRRAEFPAELETHAIFKPNKVEFKTGLSIPNWDDDVIKNLINEEDSDNYMEASAGSANQIFGYANSIQGDMELECQLVTHGLYCGDSSGYNTIKAKELEAGKPDWVLLLQIDSEEEKTGMMWGDVGRLYFWIKKQDLATKSFDKAWCILQCY